jgi:hypothetical protein
LFTDKKHPINKTFDTCERKRLAVVPGAPALQGPGSACPLLDPLLPKSEYVKSFFERRRLPVQRKVHSRISWGLVLPGRYTFATFTNVGKGKQQLANFRKIKWWLKRHYPGIAGCRVFTDEGGGVVHIVLRQGMRQKRIDKTELDLYLVETAGCGFCDLKRVYNKKGLADYLANQRVKNGLAKEMSRQTQMTKYNYFGEWLPRGWLSKFGRAWYKTMGMSREDRRVWFTKWLYDYQKNPSCRSPDHPVTWESDIGWRDMEPEELLSLI